MFRNRFFNVLTIAALVVVTALTIQQALETTRVVLAADMNGADASLCTIPLVDRSSIRSVYVKQMGIWLPQTDSGPTGVDGGLLDLLSNYRTCSQ